jgi:hypothetical protein
LPFAPCLIPRFPALPNTQYGLLYVRTRGSVVCLSAVLFLCLSVSLEGTQYTEKETFLYVRTGVLLNIPGARVLPGNLSARYTGIRANPIRAPGT